MGTNKFGFSRIYPTHPNSPGFAHFDLIRKEGVLKPRNSILNTHEISNTQKTWFLMSKFSIIYLWFLISKSKPHITTPIKMAESKQTSKNKTAATPYLCKLKCLFRGTRDYNYGSYKALWSHEQTVKHHEREEELEAAGVFSCPLRLHMSRIWCFLV